MIDLPSQKIMAAQKFSQGMKVDSRSCIIDGSRQLLLCGTIHYPRSTPEMWPALMRHAKDAGLNCIETYVFWGLHEKQRGVFDFTGRIDLRHFCECAAAEGLNVFLRPGPYICAEQDFGGFPAWLRDVPGVRFRTRNQPYYDEVKRWLDVLFEYVRPLFAPNGGPIIALQVENEYANIGAAYGADGIAYIEWLRDLFLSYETGVPLTSCNPAGDDGAMAALDQLPGTVPTINSGFAHPFVRSFRKWAQDYPCLWTEAWMAWYQIWGLPKTWRPASDMTFCAARFFAEGGKGINYYLWHGGTNFGRQGMYLQATQYEFDAALDEFGCPSLKFDLLKSLHAVLLAHEDLLVENDLPEAHNFTPTTGVRIFRLGNRSIEFVFNDAVAETPAIAVTWAGQQWRLPGQTVIVVVEGVEQWRVEGSRLRDVAKRTFVDREVSFSAVRVAVEPIPKVDWIDTGSPHEQLIFTKNRSDYAWYKTRIEVSSDGVGVLRFDGINDFFQVFIDGARVAVSRSHLVEDRGPWDGADYQQQFNLKLSSGRHELTLLVSSLGLVKGDWQAGRRNMVEERKGFWGQASWHSKQSSVVFGRWQIHPFLASGTEISMAGDAVALKTRNWEESDLHVPLRWFEMEFRAPEGKNPLAVDLRGLGKGLTWINGNCIGRYWMVASKAPTVIHTEHNQVMNFDLPGTPSQQTYHLPREWILPGKNILRFFEEIGGDPRAVRLLEWAPISNV